LDTAFYVIEMSGDKVEEGDQVTWNWNGNYPGGTAAEVKEGEVSAISHCSNGIKETGDSNGPAVYIERSDNEVIKMASDLNVEPKSSGGSGFNGTEKVTGREKKDEEKKDERDDETKDAGDDETKAGDKRKANERADGDKEDRGKKDEEENDAKKQKTVNGSASNGTKRGPGRPKGSGANGGKKAGGAKEKKVPAVGKSERKTRSQGNA